MTHKTTYIPKSLSGFGNVASLVRSAKKTIYCDQNNLAVE